jgi:uncharacterized protein (DUF427 family)
MSGYPELIFPANHVEPVPRRIRGVLHDHLLFDSTEALYVWDSPYYPHYYIPMVDVDADVLIGEEHEEHLRWGAAKRYGLAIAGDVRPGVAHFYTTSEIEAIAGTVRFNWLAIDSWFEEDEQIFVHPLNPYARVGALQSTRLVQIEYQGTELARSNSTVMVFETGLPTRYYFNRTETNFGSLVESDTVSACHYKGQTSAYWSGRFGDQTVSDIAWSYGYPNGQLQAIAGLVAFYNEKVDVLVDGVREEKPSTRFVKAYQSMQKVETGETI